MLTKRITIVLLSLFLSVDVFAAEKDLEKDITMVSYEQSWMDREGALSLKNNTSEEIKNLAFMIIYLDMSGREVDYNEFTRSVSIAPGMTRKLDIPAYEFGRSYHYYQSEGGYNNSTPFKIRFKLKDYNVEPEKNESKEKNTWPLGESIKSIDAIPFGEYRFGLSDDDHSDHSGAGAPVASMIMLLPFLGITIGLFILAAVMARKRNRSVFGWFLLSLIIMPLMAILILLVIGPKNGKKDDLENHYARE